jgi:hypothetical protein
MKCSKILKFKGTYDGMQMGFKIGDKVVAREFRTSHSRKNYPGGVYVVDHSNGNSTELYEDEVEVCGSKRNLPDWF